MATANEKALIQARNQRDSLGSFSYKDSGLLTDYNAAKKEYDTLMNNPGANGYNQYITDVNDLFDQVMNQEQFSYDPSKDALFQMYKKQYHAQGTKAMQNAMGVGAAMSGGYNSSAAQTASQSTYNKYLDALNDKVGETYQNALDMYKYNQQNLLDRYNTMREMNNTQNKAYWNRVNAASNRVNTAYNAWSGDRQQQYTQWNDTRNYLNDRVNQLQTQVNWDKDYALRKKAYTGK